MTGPRPWRRSSKDFTNVASSPLHLEHHSGHIIRSQTPIPDIHLLSIPLPSIQMDTNSGKHFNVASRCVSSPAHMNNLSNSLCMGVELGHAHAAQGTSNNKRHLHLMSQNQLLVPLFSLFPELFVTHASLGCHTILCYVSMARSASTLKIVLTWRSHCDQHPLNRHFCLQFLHLWRMTIPLLLDFGLVDLHQTMTLILMMRMSPTGLDYDLHQTMTPTQMMKTTCPSHL